MTQRNSIMWKGIAILFVLFGHLDIVPMGGQIGVVIFLVLSGYGLTASYHYNGLSFFWKKRITGVWIPYVLWELSAAIILFIIKSDNVSSLPKTIFSILAIKPASVIDAQWYVTYIMIMYAVYWMARKMKVTDIMCAVIMAVAGTTLGVLSLADIFPRYAGMWYYSFCFSAGVLLYASPRKADKSILLGFSTFFLSVVMYCVAICISGKMAYVCTMVFSLTLTVFVCIVIMSIDVGNQLLFFVGKNSYYIFLCNTFLISQTRSIFFARAKEFDVLSRLVLLLGIIALGTLLNNLYSICKERLLWQRAEKG